MRARLQVVQKRNQELQVVQKRNQELSSMVTWYQANFGFCENHRKPEGAGVSCGNEREQTKA